MSRPACARGVAAFKIEDENEFEDDLVAAMPR
jgi:hypothetical protein